jgi:hypothetical protein
MLNGHVQSSSANPARAGHFSPRTALIALLFACGFTTLVGCQAPPAPTGPTQMVLDIADYDVFLDDTLALLRQVDLNPIQMNRNLGVIRTRPTTSAQWFEFWRVDARGDYQTLENNLQTIQRDVTIELTPLDGDFPPPEASAAWALDAAPATDPDTDSTLTAAPISAQPERYRVTVAVNKRRLSVPQRQITTASGALAIYSPRTPTRAGLSGLASWGDTWVPLGRDPLLEEYLITRLAALPPVVSATN